MPFYLAVANDKEEKCHALRNVGFNAIPLGWH